MALLFLVNSQQSTVKKNFQLSIHYKLYTLNSTLSTLHFIWAFRLSPSGFPLFLCSPCFRLAPRIPSKKSRPRPRALFPFPLAKDAAPIPNALGDVNDVFFIRRIVLFHKAMPYAIYVSPFQGSLSIVSVRVIG